MNILTYELQAACTGLEIFSIYNVYPGDFRPGEPSEENFEAPGLRFKHFDSEDCSLEDAIFFEPGLPQEKRTAILDCLQGKDSPAKLYCCDLSNCHDGVRLFFIFSMEKRNSACIFDYAEVHLRGFLQFVINNTEEHYCISVYKQVKEDGGYPAEYSFFVEVAKEGSDTPLYALRIIKSQLIEVTQFNY